MVGAVVDDHAGLPTPLEMHGVEEHVVACENSDDTDAVADTDVAFDDYCSCRIQNAVDDILAADIPALNRVAAVNGDTTGDDTFGVVAGIDVGDSPPRL